MEEQNSAMVYLFTILNNFSGISSNFNGRDQIINSKILKSL
jgi:hypothetical protein